ncbi:TatD family hydrolase [Actinotignum timonense]|uniref:TatD family hydrolase n=1 Tax=Actinotignum TaxID=1653174 RepID=UPI00254DAB78|nr:TatD family hydrolase [Actinotignum timonense]MDK6906706.1 TatD family hydrolase [Actinotignum timonense]MDK8782350.1 TatD family hydrolase [Actinotignum timonense]
MRNELAPEEFAALSAKEKKRARRWYLPDAPARLAGPVIDNHTHIWVPAGEGQAGGSGSATAAHSASASASPGRAALTPPRGRMLPSEEAAAMDAAGVCHAITCACEVPDLLPTVAVAEADRAHFSAALAIHPNEAARHRGITATGPDGLAQELAAHHTLSLEDAIGRVAEAARSSAVVAIGETGLDYFRTSEEGRAAQIEAFRAHLALARELDLPVQIHDREAHADCVEVLRRDGAPSRVVFHAFSGDAALAELCTQEGWYGSFGGQMTYPANDQLRAAFQAFDPALLLAETDAPYLTPVPWRGHPNAPYVMAWTVRFGAELRGVSEADWCAQLLENTRAVYGELGAA